MKQRKKTDGDVKDARIDNDYSETLNRKVILIYDKPDKFMKLDTLTTERLQQTKYMKTELWNWWETEEFCNEDKWENRKHNGERVSNFPFEKEQAL